MAAKRPQPHGSKPKPLVDRYTYITSVKAGNRTIAWLAIDRTSKRVVVAAPVGKARLVSLKAVLGLTPGHLAPIIRLLRTPDSAQLPADLGSTRPVGIAIADYVPGDTLHARLKVSRLPPLEAVNLCVHVVRAVRAMHDAGTAHGAISPRSVVITPKGKWSAPVVTQLIAPTSGGFSSRERLQKRGPSFEDDSWAAHATLHAALTAEGPFAGTTREELLQNMFGSKPRRLDEFGVNEPELQKIIDAGLVTNPRFRASLGKLEESLEKWIAERGQAILSLPPGSGGEPMFPREDSPDIILSEPPLQSDTSAAVILPRPHGKSLVGIVIDEPIDADAPAFAPPKRPEDLLDAVDDEDGDGGGEEEDDATVIYRPKGDEPGSEDAPEPVSAAPLILDPAVARALAEPRASEARAAAAAPEEPEAADAAPSSSATPAQAEAGARPKGKREKSRRAGPTGGGQALAAALALAVVVVVTLVVHYRRDSGAATVESASPPPSASATAARSAGEQAECVATFFPDNSIDAADDFAFLCDAVDLRSTVKQLETRVGASKASGKAEATKLWDKLGWFELPLTARLQQSCCAAGRADRIVLPQPPPKCQSLSVVLKELTTATLAAESVAAETDDFERVVECLTAEKQASAYGYEANVSSENRETFRGFLQREAAARKN
ncbi:MAG TPA: hypothetical protein VI197_22490 [Polyangiaceae bacterium]